MKILKNLAEDKMLASRVMISCSHPSSTIRSVDVLSQIKQTIKPWVVSDINIYPGYDYVKWGCRVLIKY